MNKKMTIRKSKSGAIRDADNGKEDYVETISWSGLKIYAQYMTEMKKKYGPGNFKKGMPVEWYEQSLCRHVQKHFDNKYEGGVIEKDEDNIRHICAIVFNALGILHEHARSINLTK